MDKRVDDRKMFIAAALTGIMANPEYCTTVGQDATLAIEAADAVMRSLEKEHSAQRPDMNAIMEEVEIAKKTKSPWGTKSLKTAAIHAVIRRHARWLSSCSEEERFEFAKAIGFTEKPHQDMQAITTGINTFRYEEMLSLKD